MREDGKIIFSTALDNKGLEKDLAKLRKEIAKQEDAISKGEAKKSPLIQQAEELKVKMKAAQEEVEKYKAEWTAGVAGADKNYTAAQLRDLQLQAEYDGVVGKIGKIDDDLLPAYTKLEAMKKDAGEMEHQLAKTGPSARRMANAVEKAERNARRFSLRMKEVLRSALIFTLITQSMAKFRDWMGKVIRANDEATAAVARLQGALLTLAQPLVEVVVPVLTTIVDLLGTAIYILATLFSAAQGKTIEESSEAAKNLHEETEAIDGVGAAAKKASGALASFDEINRLAGESAGSAAGGIKPDFSGASLDNLAGWLRDLVFDLEAKIRELRFSWDEGELAKNKDAWIVALSGLLGAVLGGMFGGINGTLIGLLLGLSVGLISCTFLDKLENPDLAKDLFMVVLSSILGAVLGGMFGGVTGAVIGLLLGALISLIALEFVVGDAQGWDEKNTIITVLSAILGAILGAVFGGLAGGVIGFLLGALISFIAIKFSEGNFNKDQAIASLRIALLAILGLILGLMFGGLSGGVLGLILGMTIGFASVAFDPSLNSGARQKAQSALKVALTTIIGALVGAVFGGGIFGGIVGGVVGLTLGLAVTFGSATVKNKTGLGQSVSNYSSWTGTSSLASVASLPALATGAVIPPNREFLAVLGDQTSGNNIETPEALLRKIVREEGGSRMSDSILREILVAIREGQVIAVNDVVLGRVLRTASSNAARASGTSTL